MLYDIESRFTVKNLKSFCAAVGVPISGTKGLLQQRLRSWFDQIVAKQDVVRFNIAKTAAEAERGVPYERTRYARYINRGVHDSRPNGFHSSGTSAVTPAQTNTWGMSSLYQNVRLRMSLLVFGLMSSYLQEDAVL